LDISIICWFRVIRVLFYLSGIFIVDKVDGVGDRGSGNTIAVHVQIPFESFWNMSLISAVSLRFFFYGKKQNFWSSDYSPSVPD
jgi:hypothetical protein